MSWLFSRALVAAYLADTCLDGGQSAPLSGSLMQLAYLPPDKMTAFSRVSRFGMTFRPLTENRGEELLTLYLADFHAKTSPQQEKAQELTESEAECGEKWRGWFAKFDPNTSSWKTPQCSLLGDSELYSETWPRWGTMRNGECWEQQTLVPHIKETESGLWPTPVHSEARQGLQIRRDGKKGSQQSLTTAVMTWPTPRTAGMCGGTGSWDLLNKNTTVEEARQMGAGNGGKLNPDWVEWLMNWPIKWSNLNEFNPKEFKRWQKESATDLQESVQMRTVWWNKDPSQTSSGQQSDEQQLQQYSNSLSEMSWDDTRKREVERPHEGQNMSLLRENIHIQASEGKNVQQTVREQIGMDEAQIIPRTSENIIARIDRLKAIGNGQVPLCAASAWRILNELATS